MEGILKKNKDVDSDLDFSSQILDKKKQVAKRGCKGNQNSEDLHEKSWYTINRKTLPIKITLFLYYGAMSAILPYLTIHMKDIGISLSQIAIIYAILPFTAFLGPPVMGFFADKFGQYKSVLVVATIMNGVFHTLLLTVPKYNETLVYSSAIIEIRGTSEGGGIYLRPSLPSLCESFHKSLLLNSGKGKNPFRNQIINVNCTKNEENNLVVGGIFTRSGPPAQENSSTKVSELCQMEVAPIFEEREDYDDDYVEDDEGDSGSVIVSYTCGNVFTPPSFPQGEARNNVIKRERRSRSRSSANMEKLCSVNVKINPGIIPTPHNGFTCQTNYSFPTSDKNINGNGPLTFWLYFLIRIIANLFMIACFSLLDATTLVVVGSNEGAEYGRERILCTIGNAAISPLAGLIVDQVSTFKGYTDYSAAFYLSNVLLFLNVIGYFFMKLDVEKPEDHVWKNATDLLDYPEVVVFLGMIFVMGNMWGFVESYLFIFLDELNAPKYLLGLTLTVGSLAGIPFLFFSGYIVAKAGRVNIIVLAFLVYFIRFFGYSYIPNPFWCFPFESMEAFTFHLMWVAAATYCAVLAPKGLLATLNGVMGSLHYGLGKGSGAFIGGYVMNATSTRLSFRYFGIFAGVTGVFYFLINKFWLEGAIKMRNNREQDESDDGPTINQEQKEAMIT